MALTAHVLLEIFEFVEWPRNWRPTIIYITPVVKEGWDSLQVCVLYFSLFQVWLFLTELLDRESVPDTADEGSDPAKIEHERHRAIKSIHTRLIYLLVDLGSCQTRGRDNKHGQVLCISGQSAHHHIRQQVLDEWNQGCNTENKKVDRHSGYNREDSFVFFFSNTFEHKTTKNC